MFLWFTVYKYSVRHLQSTDNRLIHLTVEITVSDTLQLEVRVTFLQHVM